MEAQRGVHVHVASLNSTAQAGPLNGGDWQEEIYKKMKRMKEKYLTQLHEMYENLVNNLKKHDSLQQHPNSEKLENIKSFKSALERAIAFLQHPKSSIQPGDKEKLVRCEKFINFLNSKKPREAVPQMQMQQQQPQPGQLPSSHMLPQMRQRPSQHSQISQVLPLENQLMKPQMQSLTSQGGSMPTMQPSNMSNLQQNSGLPQQQQQRLQLQRMMSLMGQQPNPSMDIVGQGNVMTQHMQQQQLVPLFSLQQQQHQHQQQQNPGCGPQLASMNPMYSQYHSINPTQPNMNAIQQTNPAMLQHAHIQQDQQQIMQNQQFKQQYHQRQHQMPLQIQQQLQQQQKLKQILRKLEANEIGIRQIEQICQMRDVNNRMKMRQQNMAMKSSGMPQQSGTRLQSGSLPSIVPSPSILVAPSPMPGDSEKPVPSNGVGADVIAAPPAQSLAIGTPGISASPLLAEFSGPDGTHGNALATVSGESIVTERPVDRLMKVEKSMSSKALTEAVSDIGSVVSMMDRIPGSAAGNGSRAAVREDLVLSFKRRKLQADHALLDELRDQRLY